jgi:HPt (histidine-containing phosphotransfer) domain-containing protein
VSEPDFAAIFREEAGARFDRMVGALLALESGEAGAEAIDELFREAHSLKGSAGMLGFNDVSAVAHAVEDVLGEARAAGLFRRRSRHRCCARRTPCGRGSPGVKRPRKTSWASWPRAGSCWQTV